MEIIMTPKTKPWKAKLTEDMEINEIIYAGIESAGAIRDAISRQIPKAFPNAKFEFTTETITMIVKKVNEATGLTEEKEEQFIAITRIA